MTKTVISISKLIHLLNSTIMISTLLLNLVFEQGSQEHGLSFTQFFQLGQLEGIFLESSEAQSVTHLVVGGTGSRLGLWQDLLA